MSTFRRMSVDRPCHATLDNRHGRGFEPALALDRVEGWWHDLLMRGTDAVEWGLEFAPRHAAKAFVWTVLVLAMFAYSDPIMWFFKDKADGLAEYWTNVWLAAAALPAPSHLP